MMKKVEEILKNKKAENQKEIESLKSDLTNQIENAVTKTLETFVNIPSECRTFHLRLEEIIISDEKEVKAKVSFGYKTPSFISYSDLIEIPLFSLKNRIVLLISTNESPNYFYCNQKISLDWYHGERIDKIIFRTYSDNNDFLGEFELDCVRDLLKMQEPIKI